jgi:hypothetical protein
MAPGVIVFTEDAVSVALGILFSHEDRQQGFALDVLRDFKPG